MQATLTQTISFEGVGLHSGKPVRMDVHPAAARFGIWFKRTDVTDADNMIRAIYSAVGAKPLCSELSNEDGVGVSTVEHIMAALAGCGIHNALIELDGPEVPIMDGCSADFVRAIVETGARKQAARLYAIEVLSPVMVEDNGAMAMLTPAGGLEIDFHIEFPDAAIGRQHMALDMRNGTFVRELSDSRTFCRKADIDMMHENGLALGGTYENAVVVDGDDVLSPGGLRHADEAVRHKMLDALGDLALAGAPILGRYTGIKAGHAMTNKLLRKLFANPSSYRFVPCSPEQAARLPGVGVRKADLALVA
ncbi:UDP-3-O-acyl-N-acetylglucosamine deacetylase [Litoreibacter janthinus]|uniref:UDP-3-O-acyl-N-acetylglucosamine deacetylase n=1 Tax=Litoreibacter janthinus TaxID=670154 RepID=A0A1I6GNS0_9RHOB|nr:UDP-3-O-acyl-N-acetylglucosamine deacetylase [Litoreibacter janthinus]SFR43771.1 UDP-3-O-[3-hydroxymyristoyl] N-acetylglucosamine deacetylase [Litoreibacter janthinus]